MIDSIECTSDRYISFHNLISCVHAELLFYQIKVWKVAVYIHYV